VSVASGSPLGNAIIVGVMLADGVHYYRLGPDGKTSVRAPNPIPTARSTSRIARVRLIRMRATCSAADLPHDSFRGAR